MEVTLQREPTSPAGQDTDAGRVLNNFTRIESAVNGNLADDNAAASSPCEVVTSIPAGTRQGQKLMLRVASSPFEFVELEFDESYDRWVSAPVTIIQQQELFESSVDNQPLTDVPAAQFPSCWIPNFKSLYDAGLRPQIRIGGRYGPLSIVQTTKMLFAVSLREVNDGDTTLNTLGHFESGIFTPDQALFLSAFGDVSPLTAPTEAHVLAVPQVEWEVQGTETIPNVRYDQCEGWLRWASV
jgi:hypothetical protein